MLLGHLGTWTVGSGRSGAVGRISGTQDYTMRATEVPFTTGLRADPMTQPRDG